MLIVYFFISIFCILCATSVIVVKNPIYSSASLVACFSSLGLLYLLNDASFVAVFQILIYSGAVVVLFVFVLMLLDFDKIEEEKPSFFPFILAALATWGIGFFIFRALHSHQNPLFFPQQSNLVNPESQLVTKTPSLLVKSVSHLLFTQYFWPFEILTLFLLIMMVSVYLITRVEKKT